MLNVTVFTVSIDLCNNVLKCVKNVEISILYYKTWPVWHSIVCNVSSVWVNWNCFYSYTLWPRTRISSSCCYAFVIYYLQLKEMLAISEIISKLYSGYILYFRIALYCMWYLYISPGNLTPLPWLLTFAILQQSPANMNILIHYTQCLTIGLTLVMFITALPNGKHHEDHSFEEHDLKKKSGNVNVAVCWNYMLICFSRFEFMKCSKNMKTL